MRDFNFKEILTAANSLPSTGMLNYQQCNRWTRALWISAVGSRAQPGRELDFLQVLTRLDPYGDHDEFFHTPWLLEQMASSAKSPEDRKRLHALLEIWKQDQNFWKRRLRAQFVHVVGLYNGKLEGLLPDFIKDYRAAEEIKFFEGQPTRGDLDLGFLGGPGAAGMKMRKYWRTRCDLEFVEVKLALEEARGPAGYPAEMPPPGWDTERTWEYRSWGSGYELKVAAPRAPLWSRRCGQDYTFWEREVRSPGQAAERL